MIHSEIDEPALNYVRDKQLNLDPFVYSFHVRGSTGVPKAGGSQPPFCNRLYRGIV